MSTASIQNYGMTHLRKAATELVSLKSRLAKHKERAFEVGEIFLGGALTCVGAGLGGLAIGRFPDKTFFGLKPDVAGGAVTGALAAYLLWNGHKNAALMASTAFGFLGGAAYRFGAQEGAKMGGRGAVSGLEIYGGQLPQQTQAVPPFPTNVARFPSPAERAAQVAAQQYAQGIPARG